MAVSRTGKEAVTTKNVAKESKKSFPKRKEAVVTPMPIKKLVFVSGNTRKAIEYLSSKIGPRREGTVLEHSAARYIYYRLTALGYEPQIQRFMLPNGRNSQNIIVTKKGIRLGKRLIFGAHYDTKSVSPGANDNASGVAALIELSRVIKDFPLKQSVDFIFFGSEEIIDDIADHHHYGSRYYASSMSPEARKNIKGMISVDTIGVGSNLYIRNLGIGSPDLCKKIQKTASTLGLKAFYKTAPAWSDHEPFERIGIDTAWIEYPDDPNYHGRGDTADKIDYDNVQKVGNLLLAYLKTFK